MTGGRWQGRFDLGVGSVAPTKARAEVIDRKFIVTAPVYVVHADSSIQSEEDLNGKIIGVETATASEDFVNAGFKSMHPAYPRFSIILSLARCARFRIE